MGDTQRHLYTRRFQQRRPKGTQKVFHLLKQPNCHSFERGQSYSPVIPMREQNFRPPEEEEEKEKREVSSP